MTGPNFSWLRNAKKVKPTHKDIISQWMETRQDLIIYLEKISGLHPYPNEHIPINPESIEYLRQLCTDYLSLGHFRVFEHISAEYDKINPGQGIDGEYLSILEALTQRALDLSDDLVSVSSTQTPAKLGELWKNLEMRFEIEDQLRALYLSPQLKGKLNENPRPRL